MNVDEILKDSNLDPDTINQVVRSIQKAVEKYNGVQIAVALTLLLRILIKNENQQQIVDAIVDSYDVKFGGDADEE